MVRVHTPLQQLLNERQVEVVGIVPQCQAEFPQISPGVAQGIEAGLLVTRVGITDRVDPALFACRSVQKNS